MDSVSVEQDPVGDEQDHGVNGAGHNTSRNDREVDDVHKDDVISEEDPVAVKQDHIEDGTGHVKSSQGRGGYCR